jgi:hypothetical protein
MIQESKKDYRAGNSGIKTKRSAASIGLTVGEAHLTFLIFTLLVPLFHAI